MPSMFAEPTSADKPRLSQFDYGQVTLLEGPMLNQFTRNHQFFLSLDEDGLLRPFRERAGLSAPGPVMGGWYNDSPDFRQRGPVRLTLSGWQNGGSQRNEF